MPSVDRANSDGTGVTCLDCDNAAAVTAILDEMDSVESYNVR